MQGLTGSFFKPLITAYVLAIAASLVVAMTVTPALCLILLRNARLEGRESPVIVWLQRRYAPLLERATRTPRAAYVAVGVVTLAGIGVWPLLGHSLLPSFKERDFLMHWVTTPDTSLPEMLRITTRASKELRAIPGVRNFGAHIGQAFAADEVVRRQFRRELDQHQQRRRLRQDACQDRGNGGGLSRPLPRCADLSEGAHSRGPDRRWRGDRRPHLRPGSRRSQGQGGGGPRGTRGHSGPRQPAQGVDGRSAAHSGDGEAGRSTTLRSEAGRCPACLRDPDGRRGGRRHLHRRTHLRRAGVDRRRHPATAWTRSARC